AGEVGTRYVNRSRPGTGGEQQGVVGHRRAVIERDGVPGPIDREGPAPEARLDGVVRIEFGRANQEALPLHFPGQILLRKRRTLIGERRLLADERNRPLETATPEHIGSRSGCLTRTDNNDSFWHRGGE